MKYARERDLKCSLGGKKALTKAERDLCWPTKSSINMFNFNSCHTTLDPFNFFLLLKSTKVFVHCALCIYGFLCLQSYLTSTCKAVTCHLVLSNLRKPPVLGNCSGGISLRCLNSLHMIFLPNSFIA